MVDTNLEKSKRRISMRELMCFCGTIYSARETDIKRGWAKTCSKRCAAIKRKHKKPNARDASTGAKIKYGSRPNYSSRHRTNTAKNADEKARQGGHFPFDSENEMYNAMCDNPIEGR